MKDAIDSIDFELFLYFYANNHIDAHNFLFEKFHKNHITRL